MRPLLSIILLAWSPLFASGQDETEGDVYQVINKLVLQHDTSYSNKFPLLLQPKLGEGSLQIIKLARSTLKKDEIVVKRSVINGRASYDTLKLNTNEKQYLDSCLSNVSAVCSGDIFNNYRTQNCILLDSLNSIKYSNSGVRKYQIMQPIFLRNRTVAFAFYRSDDLDFHAEFTILIKQADEWLIWDRFIVLES